LLGEGSSQSATDGEKPVTAFFFARWQWQTPSYRSNHLRASEVSALAVSS